tara:strand:- start:882 stop:1499 length:618 start_codon:yes stop_codon:yes gene_type:complete
VKTLFSGFFALIAMAIAIVNMLGPIISGIWLGVIGEWGLLGMGLLYMMFGVAWTGLLILPAMGFAVGAGTLADRGSRIAAIIAAIPAFAWTYAVAIGTSVIVFMFTVGKIDWNDNPIPYLFWGFSVATSPWSYMAMKEMQAGNNHGGASLAASFLTIGCALAAIWYLVDGAESWQDWAVRIGGVMIFGLAFQLLEVILVTSRPRY